MYLCTVYSTRRVYRYYRMLYAAAPLPVWRLAGARSFPPAKRAGSRVQHLKLRFIPPLFAVKAETEAGWSDALDTRPERVVSSPGFVRKEELIADLT